MEINSYFAIYFIHVWLDTTVLGSTFKPSYIQNHLIMNWHIKRFWCITWSYCSSPCIGVYREWIHFQGQLLEIVSLNGRNFLYAVSSILFTGNRGSSVNNGQETTCEWEGLGETRQPLHHLTEWQRYRLTHQNTGNFCMMCNAWKGTVQFADSAGPDQPTWLWRLIRTCILHLQNQWIL